MRYFSCLLLTVACAGQQVEDRGSQNDARTANTDVLSSQADLERRPPGSAGASEAGEQDDGLSHEGVTNESALEEESEDTGRRPSGSSPQARIATPDPQTASPLNADSITVSLRSPPAVGWMVSATTQSVDLQYSASRMDHVEIYFRRGSRSGCEDSLEGWSLATEVDPSETRIRIDMGLWGPGRYHFCLVGEWNHQRIYRLGPGSLHVNAPPTLTTLTPMDVITSDGNYRIEFAGMDPEEDPWVHLHLLPSAQKQECQNPPAQTRVASRKLSHGSFDGRFAAGTESDHVFVCAHIDDGINQPIHRLSEGSFHIAQMVRPHDLPIPQSTNHLGCPGQESRIRGLLLIPGDTPVSTPEDFTRLTMHKTYVLQNDIELDRGQWLNLSRNLSRLQLFGNGHTITLNGTINRPSGDWALFNSIGSAHVKDLNLVGFNVKAPDRVALLGRSAVNSIFENITIDGATIEGTTIGGLVRQVVNTCFWNISVQNSLFKATRFSGGIVGGIDDDFHSVIANSRVEGSQFQISPIRAMAGGEYIGSLVGYMRGGRILNSWSDAHLFAATDLTLPAEFPSYVGGLVGGISGSGTEGTEIRGSSFQGEISRMRERVGGIVGYAYRDVTIHDTSFQGEILLDHEGVGKVGGIVGEASNKVRVHRSQARGHIRSAAQGPFGRRVGGLVGLGRTFQVTESRSTTEIVARQAGGLVGEIGESSLSGTWIANNYFAGNVQGHHVGGLLWSVHPPRTFVENNLVWGGVTASSQGAGLGVQGVPLVHAQNYWDKDATGQTFSAFGQAKTTVEIMDPATYVGWDTGMWHFPSGQTPVLQWEP